MRIGPVRLLLTACLLTVGAVVFPLGGGVALAHPTPNFDWTPKPVVAGAPVTFVSTSTPHPGTTITKTAWDLDGRATCNGPPLPASTTCTTTAPAPGDWKVKVTVEDSAGESDSLTKTVAVQAPPPPPPNKAPTAAFAAIPSSPLVGEEVTVISYSEDSDGNITGQTWDLDGDGAFDDASGAIATRRYSLPGPKTITLRVTDDRGASSTFSLAVLVRDLPAGSPSGTAAPNSRQPLGGPTPLPRLLSPFPIIRLVGSVTQVGTGIELLTVRAPKGSHALVRCRGQGCPVKRVEKVVRRTPLRLRAVESVMQAGVVLEVLVRRSDRIGKFTRFKFRWNRRPLRTDGCLWPGTTRMAPCPRA
jgi:hypothetical protein